MSADDHDRIMRLIMARCGDVLSANDLALLAQPDPEALPATICEGRWRSPALRGGNGRNGPQCRVAGALFAGAVGNS